MKMTTKLYKEMRDAANKERKECIARNKFPYLYTRDFTDESLVYGMRRIPVYECVGLEDGDHYNLGRCLSADFVIPKYTFFRFRHMLRILYDVCDECGMGLHHIKHLAISDVIGPIIRVLASNSKYYQTFYGSKGGIRICIFLYRGPNTHRLGDLARHFEERDRKVIIAESEYHRKALTRACDRIMMRLQQDAARRLGIAVTEHPEFDESEINEQEKKGDYDGDL